MCVVNTVFTFAGSQKTIYNHLGFSLKSQGFFSAFM